MSMTKKTITTTLFFAIHILLVRSFREKTLEESGPLIIPIGVIVDLTSRVGAMAKLCMEIAISEFYKEHSNYSTRLQLHTRNADNSLLSVNSSALELFEQERVQGIVGMLSSTEATTLLAEIGLKFHVPIISFVSISHSNNSYLVRRTPDDAARAEALAAICRKYRWPEVSVVYEDTYNGYKFLSDITKSLQKAKIRFAYAAAIPSSSTNKIIIKELKKLMTRQSKIFLVHVSPPLGFRLFNLAKKLDVMSEGHAWITSDSLSIFMNSVDRATRDSMEGVIGIRPYVKHSKKLDHFKEKFKRNVILANISSKGMELNVYGLWAYDVVTALAVALERLTNTITNGTALLNELSKTKFRGLSGEFQLIGGKLKMSGFEIFNVVGSGDRTIGFWTPEKGIIREWSSTSEEKPLKSALWLGDSNKQPNGWDIPNHVRVGIPWKEGFKEFVDASTCDPKTISSTNATGFSIDIFLEALNVLPFSINYTFLCYNETNHSWSYDDMLRKIPQEYDMVVGDTTIWDYRTNFVDFSLPYLDSGVVLVVKNKKPIDMWTFVRPLRWDLWLVIIGTCITLGMVIRLLEPNEPDNGVDPMATTRREHRNTVLFSPIAVLAFPERNMVSNAWSFVVLVFWLFMAFIIMQSYTANLSAILTLDQLKFAFSDNYNIGWQEGSIMTEFLIKHLRIERSRLKSYSSPKEYHEAMSKGTKNGGIDAIFDEIPYMRIFLHKYDSQYKIFGPTYRTGGFGFAFPKDSRLIQHFSKAILNVTQSSRMTSLEQKNFGPGYSTQDPFSPEISQQTSSLTPFDFAGLFMIVGSVTFFALLCSKTAIGKNLTNMSLCLLHNVFDIFKTSNGDSIRDDSNDVDSIEGRDVDSFQSINGFHIEVIAEEVTQEEGDRIHQTLGEQ
ncbi:glutamate receptor 2.7-like [Andrographis paniculata]|uniref:glutamate receptor 2.7-like n=1 Tax=Andrographis paniculata TaxID=175694 RepID=UPI0021E96649|nr:glutamate receptor 2.7-like [Andrographis paniculata]